MTVVERNTGTELLPAPGTASTVLQADGVRKSYRRGVWPLRRMQPVLRGVDIALGAGEVRSRGRERIRQEHIDEDPGRCAFT
jgi:hypothetical protein